LASPREDCLFCRLVVEGDKIPTPNGIKRLASGEGLFVGEKS